MGVTKSWYGSKKGKKDNNKKDGILMEEKLDETCTAKQIPSGLKSETSYTLEDGHVGRNM
jgi:hypothetical protein